MCPCSKLTVLLLSRCGSIFFRELGELVLSIGVSLPQVQEYRCPQLTYLQRKQRWTGTKIDRCKGLEGEQRNRIERDRSKKQKKVSDMKGFVFVSKLGPASERPQLNAAAYEHWIR